MNPGLAESSSRSTILLLYILLFLLRTWCWTAGAADMILVTCNQSRPAPPDDVLVPSFVRAGTDIQGVFSWRNEKF